jgi:putative aldouronate transport system substrate-binding protein
MGEPSGRRLRDFGDAGHELRRHSVRGSNGASKWSRREFMQVGAGLGAGALALGQMSFGVAQSSTPESLVPVVARGGDTVSFSYLRPTWGPATFTKDGPYQQQLQELGNVEIDVQIIPVIDFDTKINTVLASGDLPDVIWGGGPSQQIWKDAQDQGAFAPINQYLEQFPAVKGAVPQAFWDLLTDDNGDIFFIPNLIYPVVPFFIFYRKDIFDANGIAEPTNLDEFVAACEALAGNPDVSPLTMGYTWHAKDFATVWDFAEFGWQPDPEDETRIIPWFTQDPQIDMHFWFQDMYRRELLDQNYGINPEPNLSDDRFKGGQSAIALANWAAFTEFQTNLWQLDPNATVAVMDPLSETAGTRMVFPIDRGFYIAASFDNPEGFFEFLNWTLTDGTTFRRYGIEGQTFNVEGGAAVPIPDTERAAEYQSPQIEPLRFLDPMSEKLDWATIQRNFEGAGVGDQFEYIKGKFETYGGNEFYDYRNTMIISPTDGENGSRLFEDYLRSTIDSVIINAEMTREDWDAAVTEWRNAGGDDIINEVNELQEDKSKPSYGV